MRPEIISWVVVVSVVMTSWFAVVSWLRNRRKEVVESHGVRVLLWVSSDCAPEAMRVDAYEVEPDGEAFVPGSPGRGTKTVSYLSEWLDNGWKYAPLFYHTNANATTLVALEHVRS